MKVGLIFECAEWPEGGDDDMRAGDCYVMQLMKSPLSRTHQRRFRFNGLMEYYEEWNLEEFSQSILPSCLGSTTVIYFH